jgi:hypothetical protein
MVDGKLESGEASTAYGIIARSMNSDAYIFDVNEQGGWAIYVLKAGIWNTLRSGRSGQVVTGGNHLAARGVGKDLIFYANGEQIGQVSDDRLVRGGVGLIMDMSFRGAKATVTFDNFTVLIP